MIDLPEIRNTPPVSTSARQMAWLPKTFEGSQYVIQSAIGSLVSKVSCDTIVKQFLFSAIWAVQTRSLTCVLYRTASSTNISYGRQISPIQDALENSYLGVKGPGKMILVICLAEVSW